MIKFYCIILMFTFVYVFWFHDIALTVLCNWILHAIESFQSLMIDYISNFQLTSHPSKLRACYRHHLTANNNSCNLYIKSSTRKINNDND